jgi:hypothetical protein
MKRVREEILRDLDTAERECKRLKLELKAAFSDIRAPKTVFTGLSQRPIFDLAIYRVQMKWIWFFIMNSGIRARLRLRTEDPKSWRLLELLDSPKLYPSKQTMGSYEYGNQWQTREPTSFLQEYEILSTDTYIKRHFHWLERFLSEGTKEEYENVFDFYGVDFHSNCYPNIRYYQFFEDDDPPG